jgi:hypothetical protein
VSPDRLDDLAADAVHGRLADADAAAVFGWIAGGADRAEAWLRAVRAARLMHARLARRGAPPRRSRAWIPWTAAAAAALLVLVAGWWWRADSASGDGSVAVASSPRDGDGAPWPRDRPVALAPGERLSLTWDDGCRIDLDGAQARLQPGEPRLVLDAGRLRAEVAPRGASLAVATPAGTVAVIGTAFTLAVGDAAVDLAVEHGRVRWHVDGRDRILAAGATRAEPRERQGWRWETNSDRPAITELAAGIIARRTGPGPVGYTNLRADWRHRTTSLPIIVEASGPRSDVNVLAVETDGDVWLVAHRTLAGPGPVTLAWEHPEPGDLRVPQGDGRWDPVTVDHLVVSLWGDPATIQLPGQRP